MTGWNTLNADDLGANKIARSATAYALYNNPVAIAQRATGAPWLNGIGAIEAKTSGSGTWTVPAGVYRIKVTAVGSGGGAGIGTSGSSSTFSTITGGGGSNGSGGTGGAGGTASGGDLNITGTSGVSNVSSSGGPSFLGSIGHGAHGNISDAGGGGGGAAIKVFSVSPGDALSYSVGTAGGGADGIIIIEY